MCGLRGVWLCSVARRGMTAVGQGPRHRYLQQYGHCTHSFCSAMCYDACVCVKPSRNCFVYSLPVCESELGIQLGSTYTST
uniref:Putative secreted protein n=1 Tax=Ixodes ricinus TaxID=34613 RepID=A0A6B0U7X8_IXORI